MKALKVVVQIIGVFCVAVAVLMFLVGDTEAMIMLLIGGAGLLVAAPKLHKPSPSAGKIAAAWKNPLRQSMQVPAEQYVNRDLPIPPGFRSYLEDYLRESGRLEDLPKFCGRNDALGHILAGEDYRVRAQFFAYAVDCERHGKTMGDIRKARNLGKYEQFADFVGEHEELHRSLYGRPTCDYWSPSHNTKIYKAAAVWFP